MDMLAAEELKRIIDEGEPALIIDVRTPEEFAQGYIPGAYFIPTETLLAAKTLQEAWDAGLAAAAEAKGMQATASDTRIITYCYSGERSAEVSAHLMGLGFTNVTPFTGVVDWPFGFAR